TEDGLPWPDNANMAFDLRHTEDGLPWPDNANMAFDLRQTENGLPWTDNANMAFDLRQTEDGLPWPDNANMATGLEMPLTYVICTMIIIMTMEYIGPEAMEVVLKKERMSTALRAEACRMCHAGRRTADTKKSMFGRAKYRERTGPMTADTKKENMIGHAERHGRTERHERTVDTKKENMSGRKHRQL
nr:hypothetical protein [Tanacetum cinerariifolium]